MINSGLGNQLVQIFIGPERKEYSVHKTLITSTCDFFDKGFDGRFKEGVENKMSLPEDDSNTFETFVNWMYAGHLHLKQNLKSTQAINLYIFAQKCRCVKLKNDAMDALQDTLHDTWEDYHGSATLRYEEVTKIFEKSVDNDDDLRQFTIALLAWEIKHGSPMRVDDLEKIFRDVDEALVEAMQYLRKTPDVGNPRVRGGELHNCYFHEYESRWSSCDTTSNAYGPVFSPIQPYSPAATCSMCDTGYWPFPRISGPPISSTNPPTSGRLDPQNNFVAGLQCELSEMPKIILSKQAPTHCQRTWKNEGPSKQYFPELLGKTYTHNQLIETPQYSSKTATR